jgi:hypothetical protein
MTPDEIAAAYPHLTLAQVHAALAYYFGCSAEFVGKNGGFRGKLGTSSLRIYRIGANPEGFVPFPHSLFTGRLDGAL